LVDDLRKAGPKFEDVTISLLLANEIYDAVSLYAGIKVSPRYIYRTYHSLNCYFISYSLAPLFHVLEILPLRGLKGRGMCPTYLRENCKTFNK